MGCFQVLGKDAYVGHRLWSRFLRFVFAVRGSPCQLIINNPKSIKEKRGSKNSCLSWLLRLSHCPSPEDKQCPQPTHNHIHINQPPLWRWNGYTNHMNANHCFIMQEIVMNLRDSSNPQIKRQFDAILICLSPTYYKDV